MSTAARSSSNASKRRRRGRAVGAEPDAHAGVEQFARAARRRSRARRSSGGSARLRRLARPAARSPRSRRDAVRCEHAGPEQRRATRASASRSCPAGRRAGRRTPAQGPEPVSRYSTSLGLSERCVASGSPRPAQASYTSAEVEYGACGETPGSTRSDHASAARSRERRDARERRLRVGAERLEVDDRAQPEVGAGDRGRAAEGAVADRGHARAQRLGRAEPRDRDVLVEADPALALHVARDPGREVGEAVAEAAVDRVLDVRVRVDEPRQDRAALVARAGAELGRRADRRDAAVLDRHRAVLDRRALDRQDPVGGEDVRHAGSGSGRRAAALDEHREPDRGLEDDPHRQQLERRRHRVGPRQAERDEGDDEVAPAPVPAQRVRGQDPHPHEPEHDHRQLEDPDDREQHRGREREVVTRADLDPVERVVVVREEMQRIRQHDPVAEREPADRERAREQHHQHGRALRALVEGGREEGPELPEQDGQADHDGRVDADHERGHERLGDAEGDQLPLVRRQGALEPADQVRVEGERDRGRDRERDEHDDDPRAELVEMLDQRRLFAVAKAPREAPHAYLARVSRSSAWSSSARRRSRSSGEKLSTSAAEAVGSEPVMGAGGSSCRSPLCVAADRVLELAHPVPERAADLRQPLRTEEQQGDQEQDHDVQRAGPAGHRTESSAVWPPGLAASTLRERPLGAAGGGGRLARMAHEPPRNPCNDQEEGVTNLGTARTPEPARRPRGRHRDREGRRSGDRHERDARVHGPERLRQVDPRLRADGSPRLRDHRRARSSSTATT